MKRGSPDPQSRFVDAGKNLLGDGFWEFVRDIDLDVEENLSLGKLQHLRKGRNPLARKLRRERDPSVESLQLRQSQVTYSARLVCRTAQVGVMNDNQLAVFALVYIELDHVRADFDGFAKGCQRIFRSTTRKAPVGDDPDRSPELQKFGNSLGPHNQLGLSTLCS